MKRLLKDLQAGKSADSEANDVVETPEASEDDTAEPTKLDAEAVKKLKVTAIRKELKKRGLKLTGLKATLVKRLLEAVELENGIVIDEAEAQPEDEVSDDDDCEPSSLDAAAVKRLKLVDLRKELKKRGLKQTGLKATLTKRLLEAVESEVDYSREDEEDSDTQQADDDTQPADDASEEEAESASPMEATLLAEPVPSVMVPGGYAIDVIGICDNRGRLHCTDFHVHFTGPSARWSCAGEPVEVFVNDSTEPCEELRMALAKAKHNGRCYFADSVLRPEPVVVPGLRDGENRIRFEHVIYDHAKGNPVTKTRYVIEAKLFRWKVTDNVVVTDIDGTLTTSDIVGHIKTVRMSSYQYAHKGICGFFSSVDTAGLKILYLTARPITWMNETRAFLAKVTQDGYLFLPDAPVMCSIHHTKEKLFRTLFRVEYADKIKANYLHNLCEVFIRAGRQYRVSGRPLIAGFGNSKTDTRAYNAVQIPYTFNIDKKSIITFSTHEEDQQPASVAATAAASASAAVVEVEDSTGWQKWENTNAFPDDSASEMPFHNLELCQQLCMQMDYGGFAVVRGRVFFRPYTAEQCTDARRRADGVTFYRAPCPARGETAVVLAEPSRQLPCVEGGAEEAIETVVPASFDENTTVPVALIAHVESNEDLGDPEVALPVADPVAEAEVLEDSNGDGLDEIDECDDIDQPDLEAPASPTRESSEDMDQPESEIDESQDEVDASASDIDASGDFEQQPDTGTDVSQIELDVSESQMEQPDSGTEISQIELASEGEMDVREDMEQQPDCGTDVSQIELASDVSQIELAIDVSQIELASDVSQTELASEGEMDASEDMEQPDLNEDDGIGNVDEAMEECNGTVAEVLTDTTETIDDDVEQSENEATKAKSLAEPVEPNAGSYFSISQWLPALFALMSGSEVEVDVGSLKKQAELTAKPLDLCDDSGSSSDSDLEEAPGARGGFLSRLFGFREPEVDKNATIFDTYEDPKLHMLLDAMLIRCGQRQPSV